MFFNILYHYNNSLSNISYYEYNENFIVVLEDIFNTVLRNKEELKKYNNMFKQFQLYYRNTNISTILSDSKIFDVENFINNKTNIENLHNIDKELPISNNEAYNIFKFIIINIKKEL